MQVIFVDPPPRDTRRPDRVPQQAHPWETIAEQVKARPGEWALCLRNIYVTAAPIKTGKIRAFQPAGSFEVRTVQTHNRDNHGRPLVDLYLKYVGEPEAQA